MARVLYMLNKPYGISSQHSDEGTKSGWGQLDPPFDSDVYSIGRLDADSEGLLLFTNDNAFKTRMLNPDKCHNRTYHAQPKGSQRPNNCNSSERLMGLRIKGRSFETRGCKARVIIHMASKDSTVRERASIPDTWIELALDEGKNRQVRRMTAAVGFPRCD